MGLRDKMRRLEGAGRGNLEHFELRDGLRYYYDITKVQKEVFIHGIACLRADSLEVWPEVPEVYRKLCEARDPAAVLERLNSAEFVDFSYEVDTLLDERRLVSLQREAVPDLSE